MCYLSSSENLYFLHKNCYYSLPNHDTVKKKTTENCFLELNVYYRATCSSHLYILDCIKA